MRSTALIAVPVFVLMCILAGCGDSMSRGLVITGDGKVGANNERNQHESAQDVLRLAIEDDLGKGWAARVTIDEKPIWFEDRVVHQGDWGTDGAWRWEKLTALVEITPPAGQQLAAAKQTELEDGSRQHLLTKLRKKDPSLLTVTVKALAAAPAPIAPVAQVPGQRTYVVQAGDSLADLSTAFYGSPQHWRLIAEANPGGTQPGQTVIIPALPAAPAPAPAPAP